jgi:raffinose/stachyose/melibiose transport system permease protein
VLFLFPTVSSLFFSLTRWNFQSATFIGLDNFKQFFREPFLFQGLVHTLIYGVMTSGLKVILGLLLGMLLTSQIVARGYLRSVVFFPVLVSTVGIGITFTAMMHPTQGVINTTLALFHIPGPGWLTDPNLALFSVAFVDVWKGVGLATVIYMAGLVSIPQDYYEAASLDGATAWQKFVNITLPLVMPATTTVIILSLVGGLRSFDLIWAMTKGGPGFTSDVIASVIYKQYQAGFYGLSTAGNVVLFALVAIIIVPLSLFLNRRTTEA